MKHIDGYRPPKESSGPCVHTLQNRNRRLGEINQELLEALQDLLDCFWDKSPLEFALSHGHKHMDEEIGNAYLEKARAVIAKATGQDK